MRLVRVTILAESLTCQADPMDLRIVIQSLGRYLLVSMTKSPTDGFKRMSGKQARFNETG